jgi:hypothetical protein
MPSAIDAIYAGQVMVYMASLPPEVNILNQVGPYSDSVRACLSRVQMHVCTPDRYSRTEA